MHKDARSFGVARDNAPGGPSKRYGVRIYRQTRTWSATGVFVKLTPNSRTNHLVGLNERGEVDLGKQLTARAGHERESALRAVSSATNRHPTQTGKIAAKQFRISSLAGGCRRVVSGKVRLRVGPGWKKCEEMRQTAPMESARCTMATARNPKRRSWLSYCEIG